MNPNVNYDFWLVIMYWFMSYNKYIAVVRAVNNRGNCIQNRRQGEKVDANSDFLLKFFPNQNCSKKLNNSSLKTTNF